MFRSGLFAVFAVAIAVATNPNAIGAEADEAQLAATAPLPTLSPARLREESLGYKVSVSMGPNEQSGTAELTIAKDSLESDSSAQAVWRFEFCEISPSPRGNVFVLRVADLAPLEQYLKMPTGDFRLRFGSDTVSLGAVSQTSEPEQFALPAPVLASLNVAVLALPLAEGFETLARTFEWTQGTVGWKVAVVGVEAVQTPAGTFDSYKVALTCFDNDAFSATVWVSKDAPYRIVRRESTYYPEMGAGHMVIELARIDAAKSG